ncbi:hypothetical protein [Pedobacter gandavensis]|uniref:Uncharacterized protein n=1 Tax=Pedobacter gandavensis TaxID=2679963 RepID=A0ABR6ES46_9SPHI|nr:hypothetical protein [Pedobacter gandavensis]MBB2148089.1 hypothetical protein [Pedobacter gandavensis]
MKRLFIYILLLFISTDALTLDQFDKLPLFLHHFKVHTQSDPTLSLSSFISMHYFGQDLNDDDTVEDMKLPFKQINTHNSHTLFCNVSDIELTVSSKLLPASNKISGYKFHPNPALASTFRPPWI